MYTIYYIKQLGHYLLALDGKIVMRSEKHSDVLSYMANHDHMNKCIVTTH